MKAFSVWSLAVVWLLVAPVVLNAETNTEEYDDTDDTNAPRLSNQPRTKHYNDIELAVAKESFREFMESKAPGDYRRYVESQLEKEKLEKLGIDSDCDKNVEDTANSVQDTETYVKTARH